MRAADALPPATLLQPRRFSDEITTVLGSRIARGDYPPGSKLPATRELALSFGVSGPIVREALSRLKHDGLIEPRQGSGVWVRSSVATASLRLGERAELSESGLQGETLEMRLHVEQACAGLAAARRTEQDLARLRTELDAMALAVETGADGTAADVRFHIAIAQATHNRQLVRLVQYLQGTLRESVRRARANSDLTPGHPQAVQREHEAVHAAIAAADPARARRALEKHLQGAALRLAVHLGPARAETP